MTFIVRVQVEISAAHSLRGYHGNCARTHGHNWKVLAEIKANELDSLGMAVDFKELKSAMMEIANIIDHQNINEIHPFDEINPTAENIAKWFYNELALTVNDSRLNLSSITIWETDRSSVRYSE